ncbi:MAG TPA: ParB/RepB/Spo0J family partition protein [Pseudogracilibacillus sp.]|nr:ParB/RepB/Spo0J family partition protein [Pseudogracilibacillus sp.]
MGKRLGKGLNALINDIEVDVDENAIEQIDVNECRTNPYQPRKTFDADAIEELKVSILEYGIIQPLILRKSIKGYEIIAGERRFRAAKEAGLGHVPAIVREFDDRDMMEIALLENLQREDLTVIEEANAYRNLIDELGVTQDDLSRKLGKSRSHIANTIRLLSLPENLIQYINSGELTMGHGRAILGLKKKDNIDELVEKIRREHLNVRQVEHLIQEINEGKRKPKKKAVTKDPYIREEETKLTERFSSNVSIKKQKNKGKIEIEFYDDKDLNRLLELLGK